MIEEVRAGIDWLTATLPVEAKDYQVWLRMAQIAISQLESEGYRQQPRTMLGYYGVSVGNCFIGERDDRAMLQISGEKAGRFFQGLRRDDLHISRIDLQVTVKFDIMPPDIAKGAYQDAINHSQGVSILGRRKSHLITGSDGGDTAYIGSFSSEQFARIYNKEVQSEDLDYTRCWRYEIVLRNDLARQCGRNVPNGASDVESFILAFVSQWFAQRGVSIPFLGSQYLVVLPLKQTRPTDIEAKLTWLRTQVRPTIRYLRDAGYGVLLSEALGLPELDITEPSD